MTYGYQNGENCECNTHVSEEQDAFIDEWAGGLEKVLKRCSDKLNDLGEIRAKSNERLKNSWIPSKTQISYIASVELGVIIGNLIKNAPLPEYLGALAVYGITGYNICVMYNLFKAHKEFKKDYADYRKKWDSDLEEGVGD